jgi:hypothetical protein
VAGGGSAAGTNRFDHGGAGRAEAEQGERRSAEQHATAVHDPA